MKKLWILLFPLLLTGCFFGDVGKGKLTKICSSDTDNNGFIVSKSYALHYQNNEIYQVEIKETYKANSDSAKSSLSAMKETMNTRNFNLQRVEGLTIIPPIETPDSYEVEYHIDFTKLPQEYHQEFNLVKDAKKQAENLKESGMTCK